MIKALMVISYIGGPLDGYASVLPFPDARSCGSAMLTVEALVMDAAPEVVLQCQQVAQRPKRNPIYGDE